MEGVGTSMIVFTLQNKSNLAIGTKALGRWAAALQQQVVQFEDSWANGLAYVELPGVSRPGMQVPVVIETNSDSPGALGYHDIDTHGVPYIKVFTADSSAAGVSLSSVISHEILEVLGDPFVDSSVTISDGKGGDTIYMAEVCDPVEQDVYQINGVEVSNFVLPAWFGAPGSKYDHLGKLTAPFSMTSGGYFSYLTVTEQGGGWQQKQGDKARPWNGGRK